MSTERAWDLFERLWELDASEMTEVQRLFVAFSALRQELNSGGFDSYLRYAYGNDAQFAIQAAETANCEQLAVLVKRSLSRLALEPFERDCDVRAERIDSADLEFDDLDSDFYDIEGSVDLDAAMDFLAKRAGLDDARS